MPVIDDGRINSTIVPCHRGRPATGKSSTYLLEIPLGEFRSSGTGSQLECIGVVLMKTVLVL